MNPRLFILNEPTAPRLNPALACEIGLNESLILLQLEFWISISDNQRDGQQWTYQSTRDIRSKAFPFWSVMTINRTIKSLESMELIHTTSQYNTHKYDKTRWFSINYEGISRLNSISIKGYGTGSSQNGTGSSQNGTTIPEITTEIKNDVRKEPNPPPPVTTPKSTPSPSPSLELQKPVQQPLPLETKAPKKSAMDDLVLQTLIDLVPVELRKPSVIAKIAKAMKDGMAIATIRGCIFYSNEHSDCKTWQRYRSHLGRCIDEKWGEGYTREDIGADEAAKVKAFLESRRGMPDSILKEDARKGCLVSQQVLDERGNS